jgi:hypothetical protein
MSHFGSDVEAIEWVTAKAEHLCQTAFFLEGVKLTDVAARLVRLSKGNAELRDDRERLSEKLSIERQHSAELERKAARWDECERLAVSSSDTIKYSDPVTIYYWHVALRAANSRQSFAAAIDASIAERAAIEANNQGEEGT